MKKLAHDCEPHILQWLHAGRSIEGRDRASDHLSTLLSRSGIYNVSFDLAHLLVLMCSVPKTQAQFISGNQLSSPATDVELQGF